MNVSTQYGVDIELFRIMHDGLFEFADETDRVFDALLGVSAKRPVTEREATADEIDGGVKRKQKLVTNVANASHFAFCTTVSSSCP